MNEHDFGRSWFPHGRDAFRKMVTARLSKPHLPSSSLRTHLPRLRQAHPLPTMAVAQRYHLFQS